jgi:ABC-type multidrug transport system ATPase subunit
MYSDKSAFRGNLVVGNRGPSGYGLGLKDNDDLVAEDNELSGNRVGIYLDNSPNRLDSRGIIRRNRLAYNDLGLAFLPAVKRNDVSSNAFVDNLEQVAVLGPGSFTGNAFTVGGRGNYWSDYRGFDLDGDGVGDLPYKAESLFESLMDRHPDLRLFQFSPVQDAVDLATRAFPVVRPRPKLEDTAPLVDALPPRARIERASRTPLMATSAFLLLAFASTVAWTRGERRTAARPGPELRVLAFPPAPRRDMVRVTRVSKCFGRFQALSDVSLSVARGEALALWGPNGAGKSTLLRCVLGLLRFDGSILVDGENVVAQAKAARRRLGYVPQELALYPDWTARDLLAFLARIKRVEAGRIEASFAAVGLTAHAAKPIGSLSGGMKQRLALAAALLADPPLLVLDEITSNLDAAGREGLLSVLGELKAAGKTIVFTTHRRDDVLRLADRVLLLERGRVAAEVRPEAVPESAREGLEDLA